MIEFNETDNNTNNKENKDKNNNKPNNEDKKYTNIIKYKKCYNYTNDNENNYNNSKLNQFLKKIDYDKKIKSKSDNMGLKILNKKLNNKKYIDKNRNEENMKELTYTKLKRYLHCPSLRHFHAKIPYFNSALLKKENKIELI